GRRHRRGQGRRSARTRQSQAAGEDLRRGSGVGQCFAGTVAGAVAGTTSATDACMKTAPATLAVSGWLREYRAEWMPRQVGWLVTAAISATLSMSAVSLAA